MSKNLGRAPKGASTAPRIALCLAVVSALYVIYFVGAMVYATGKYRNDSGANGQYGAAVADREASHGRMTAEQKSAYVEDVKDAEADMRKSALNDWLQARRAKAFNKQLKGIWRTIPQNGEAVREFQATVYKTRFILVSHLENDDAATRAGVSGKSAWSDRIYKVHSVPLEDALEFGKFGKKSTFKVVACRDIVQGHTFEDCMTLEEDGRLLGVAYRERQLTDDEAASQRLSVSRALQTLERNGERRTFGP
ncbi:hypothetical protein G7069_02185 [Lysobacter sp. HDW10]|uniref:hypothetical protein n=1 Tax=Lysobacter sp. HDW10 TaxID=2714936 RepID=UPI00140C2115|nr:hypothetical protein [Lysobacter sp. HDW10]QIK80509.1 hypothetical protein G7069_02185 [Lysobacter sp. HDW10]